MVCHIFKYIVYYFSLFDIISCVIIIDFKAILYSILCYMSWCAHGVTISDSIEVD